MSKTSEIVKIEIVTGFSCNNNCKFCSVKRRDFDKTTEDIKKDIDRAIKESPKEINFTGGEPTIRKDIFELIKYTNGRKIKEIRVTTNGRMLSYKNFTNNMVEAGLTGAIFSIHGHKAKLHDYLTNVKGSFDQAIEGLKNLREFTEDIDVNIVINSENYKFLPEVVEMLIDKFNIRAVCLIFPTIDGNLLSNLNLVPSYNQVVDSLHKTIDIIKVKNKTC
jgi:MoaA/NifB/PqqE/SkfB family radical SAM enzyme